ncbi:MAG: hypothetical protein IKT40_07805 [Bacilli bacterium]|nr:hypothetical protein [Bacilli bacterium]
MSHYVKCSVCGDRFDRDKVECVMTGARRYAHLSCVEKSEEQVKKENEDRKKLEEYILNLFNLTKLTPRIIKQLDKYIKTNEYTYSGILKSLIYWHEVKGNDTSKSNEGIGIVEYIYEDAKKYFYEIWKINQLNKEIEMNEVVMKTNTIVIKPPTATGKKRHSIHFLEEEDEDEL